MTNQDENVQSDPLKTYGEGGPQFGLENKTGQKEGFRGWINKYGSSVALPIVALAILSGGIYLYTNQKSEQANLFSKDDLADIQEQQPGNSEQNIMPDSDQETSQPADQVIENIIPQGRKQDNTIIEKAILGDGITNLARRALLISLFAMHWAEAEICRKVEKGYEEKILLIHPASFPG